MVILVLLVLLSLAFGVGAVIKGVLWVLLIAALLLAAAAYVGYRKIVR